MDGTVLLATTFGWALVPFVLSIIYGCTGAGDRVIKPMADILTVAIGIIAFAVSSTAVRHSMDGWIGALAGALLGQLAMALAITLAYKVLYASTPKPSGAQH